MTEQDKSADKACGSIYQLLPITQPGKLRFGSVEAQTIGRHPIAKRLR